MAAAVPFGPPTAISRAGAASNVGINASSPTYSLPPLPTTNARRIAHAGGRFASHSTNTNDRPPVTAISSRPTTREAHSDEAIRGPNNGTSGSQTISTTPHNVTAASSLGRKRHIEEVDQPTEYSDSATASVNGATTHPNVSQRRSPRPDRTYGIVEEDPTSHSPTKRPRLNDYEHSSVQITIPVATVCNHQVHPGSIFWDDLAKKSPDHCLVCKMIWRIHTVHKCYDKFEERGGLFDSPCWGESGAKPLSKGDGDDIAMDEMTRRKRVHQKLRLKMNVAKRNLHSQIVSVEALAIQEDHWEKAHPHVRIPQNTAHEALRVAERGIAKLSWRYPGIAYSPPVEKSTERLAKHHANSANVKDTTEKRKKKVSFDETATVFLSTKTTSPNGPNPEDTPDPDEEADATGTETRPHRFPEGYRKRQFLSRSKPSYIRGTWAAREACELEDRSMILQKDFIYDAERTKMQRQDYLEWMRERGLGVADDFYLTEEQRKTIKRLEKKIRKLDTEFEAKITRPTNLKEYAGAGVVELGEADAEDDSDLDDDVLDDGVIHDAKAYDRVYDDDSDDDKFYDTKDGPDMDGADVQTSTRIVVPATGTQTEDVEMMDTDEDLKLGHKDLYNAAAERIKARAQQIDVTGTLRSWAGAAWQWMFWGPRMK